MLRAMVEYTSAPSSSQVIGYPGYFVILVAILRINGKMALLRVLKRKINSRGICFFYIDFQKSRICFNLLVTFQGKATSKYVETKS